MHACKHACMHVSLRIEGDMMLCVAAAAVAAADGERQCRDWFPNERPRQRLSAAAGAEERQQEAAAPSKRSTQDNR